MKRSTDNTAQIGVNAVEAIFLEMKWLFRRQLESDVGIDAHVEAVSGNRPTGQLIALQIKCGTSFFRSERDNHYLYRATARHLDYWCSFALPVLLVMHNPETAETVWCRVERHRVVVNADGSGTIAVPRHQRLDGDSGSAILSCIPNSDAESRRRQRMTVDIDIIRRSAENGAYLRLEEWVNKSLTWRGAEFSFQGPDGKTEVDYPFAAAGYSLGGLLAELFPWADFEYERPPDNYSGEVDVHTFSLSVNSLGHAFLSLEEFFRNGREAGPDPEAPRSEEYMDDDEWSESMFRRALAKDQD
jgi:hypothetical protein